MHDTLSKPPRTMTVAEFLDWPGDGSGRKFQLVDGVLNGHWPEEPEEIGRDGTLRLDSIDFACRLPEIYAQTHLA
jgi:hypothetical protein